MDEGSHRGERRRAGEILAAIHDCAHYILAVTEEKSVSSYREDRMLRQSVERNFEISEASEAMRRLQDHDPDLASRISNHPQIISFRNALIHGYDLIDHENVWRVIREDLPVLMGEVNALIEEESEGGEG